jgi:HB1, ASXL, restriction endonuclease HTH domain
MNLTKLTDTIIDLKTLRAAIDPAIDHLEKALAALKSLGVTAPEIASTITRLDRPIAQISAGSNGHRAGSHLDNVIKVLEASGKPMHIIEITKAVSDLSDKVVTRASIDGALSRHIRDSNEPLIGRIGGGTYALTSWNAGQSNPPRVIASHANGDGMTRKDAVAKYIKEHGPTLRKDLLAHTGIPVGTMGSCLNDHDRFRQLDDGRWDLVES